MKFHLIVSAAVLVSSTTTARAQCIATQSLPNLQSSFEIMKSNAGRIDAPAEKARWSANVALWQKKVGQTAPLSKADVQWMREKLATIQANVARVTESGEKERWQANVEAWQVLIDANCQLTATDIQKVVGSFERMKTNVEKLPAGDEKGRWIANRDMWEILIDKAADNK